MSGGAPDGADPGRPVAHGRTYALASLAGILLAAALLAVLYRELSIRAVSQFGERQNLTVAATALNAILPDLRGELLGDQPPAGAEPRGEGRPPPGRLLRSLVNDSTIVHIRIYGRDGRVLHSTRPHEIGTDGSANPRFQEALRGTVRSELRYRDALVPSAPSPDDNLIETYVPIRLPGEPRPVGVFELYTDVHPLVTTMAQSEIIVIAGTLAILLLLYATLVYVVRRADRIIVRQHRVISERTRTLETLAARLVAADERERGRLAIELHEDIAQTLSAIKVHAERSVQLSAPPGSPRDDACREVVRLAQEAIYDVRALAMELRPPVLDDFGLAATIRGLCREADEVRGHRATTAAVHVSEDAVPYDLKGTIFRIVQQTLKHLVRMPEVGDIRITLERDGGALRLSVAYTVPADGREPSQGTPAPRAAADIEAHWERTVLSGGTLEITRTAGGVLYQAVWR